MSLSTASGFPMSRVKRRKKGLSTSTELKQKCTCERTGSRKSWPQPRQKMPCGWTQSTVGSSSAGTASMRRLQLLKYRGSESRRCDLSASTLGRASRGR